MANRPYVVKNSGAASAAPAGSVPVDLFGVGAGFTPMADPGDLAAGADLPAVVAKVNAILGGMRSAGIIANPS